jgi:hypothetical protein
MTQADKEISEILEKRKLDFTIPLEKKEIKSINNKIADYDWKNQIKEEENRKKKEEKQRKEEKKSNDEKQQEENKKSKVEIKKQKKVIKQCCFVM